MLAEIVMTNKWIQLALAASLVCAAVATARDDGRDDDLTTQAVEASLGHVPASIKPFLPMVAAARRYNRLIVGRELTLAYTQDFAEKPTIPWLAWDPYQKEQAAAPQMTSRDEAGVLIFQPPMNGYLKFGPKVRGECAIEMEAQCPNDNPADLSILCDGIAKGPGFQFGAYGNTRNLLWRQDPDMVKAAAPPWNPQTAVITDVAPDAHITSKQWYCVRLEVRRNKVRGLVDGKVLGELPQLYFDPNIEYQPIIYGAGSTTKIRAVRVYTLGHVPPEQAAIVWSRTFGNQQAADVQKQITDLADLLDDPDEQVRDMSQTCLASIGELALPVLGKLVKDGSPEQQQRAQVLLDALPRPTTRP